MAVTAGGSPYVEASDLVADYPATSLALANKVDTKLDNALTDNAQSGATYTFVLADARQLVTATSASAKTFTIPPQSSVTWLTGSMIRVVNYGAGALTVNGGAGVTVTNTAATIKQYQAATAIRTGSNAWTLVPFAGGASNAVFSNVATGTYTDGDGQGWNYYTFTVSGTLTCTTAGAADVLIVSGGGGAGTTGGFTGGGGGGGAAFFTSTSFTAAAHTVTVGAGGATSAQGGFSGLKTASVFTGLRMAVLGGGGGGSSGNAGGTGSTGGGGSNAAGGTAGLTNAFGGNGIDYVGGGAGGNATANNLAGIGPGVSSDITGTAIVYGRGNFGSGGFVVTANRGEGGQTSGGSGSSGVVVVRTKV